MTSRRFNFAIADASERMPTAQTAGPGPLAQRMAPARASGGGLGRAGPMLLQLQRQHGNHFVGQVVSHARRRTAPPVVQAKLMLGPPGDRYEHEADRIARRAAQSTAGVDDGRAGIDEARLVRAPDIQRVRSADAGAADTGAVDATVQHAIEGARGGGQRLPDHVRRPMEEALGADLGGVRLHTDARADRLTRSVRAQAFTTGPDIFFRHGQYSPSGSGREVLAHELTHVVQQGGSPAAARSSLIQRRMGFEFETNVEVRATLHQPWPQEQRDQQAHQGQGQGQQGQRGQRGRQAQQGRQGRQGRQGQGQQRQRGQRQGPQGGQRQQVPNWRASLETFPDENEFYRRTGALWKIVPDTGRMEFVTDPLDDLGQLHTAATQIEQFINDLQRVPRNHDIRAANPEAWTAPDGSRADFTVHVGGDRNFNTDATETDWYGQPQVSVGMLTHRVSRFFAQARENQTMAGLQAQIVQLIGTPQEPPMPTKGVPAGVQNMTQLMNTWNQKLLSGKSVSRQPLVEANKLVKSHGAQLPAIEKDKLCSLWTMMRGYWMRLERYTTGGEYMKSYLSAMARTDFHSFYSNLSPNAQAAFLAGANDFAPQGDIAVIAGTGITLRRWYDSVINPEAGSTNTAPGGNPRNVDLLSARESGTNEAVATGTNKSMGQLPLDAPPGQLARAVFELRRITPGAMIPIRFMYQHVVVPIFNLIARAEQL